MPGSYYVILLIQLLFLFPVIKRFAHIYAGTSNSGAHTWWTGFIMVFIFQCAYELVTYVISLDVAIYRLLVFRYIIFIYGGAMIYEYHKVSPDMIPYKGMFKGLPVGLLFIAAAGYLGFMPSVLFRYPTWYKSSAPTAFYVVPITAYGICHADKIEELLKRNVVTKKLGQLLGFWGKASYHIYFMQRFYIKRENANRENNLLVFSFLGIIFNMSTLLGDSNVQLRQGTWVITSLRKCSDSNHSGIVGNYDIHIADRLSEFLCFGFQQPIEQFPTKSQYIFRHGLLSPLECLH